MSRSRPVFSANLGKGQPVKGSKNFRAEERTRTFTPLRAHVPETCVSTNFTTSASGLPASRGANIESTFRTLASLRLLFSCAVKTTKSVPTNGDLKDFRVMDNGRTVELATHAKALLQQSPDLQVMVGSDSQNRGGNTIYATTVVFRYAGRGAHVVYQKTKGEKVTDLWSRLWHELERSIAVADHLKAQGVMVHQIDMDYNSDPSFASNKVWSAAVGYVKSMGYRSGSKPDLLIASWAANVICN